MDIDYDEDGQPSEEYLEYFKQWSIENRKHCKQIEDRARKELADDIASGRLKGDWSFWYECGNLSDGTFKLYGIEQED